jgi:GDP-4-dehydro-6-deoxy-D-mannose reductase
MKILITGSHGFVGGFVRAEFSAHGHEVVSHDLHQAADIRFDITDAAAVARGVAQVMPDAVVHLAALAHVPTCEKKPKLAYEVNVGGTINLLEAVQQHAPKARVLMISTSQIYGNTQRPEPLKEDADCLPDHVYGVTKLSADLTTLLYHRSRGMHTMTARPANHIGPGQSPDFVVPSFAKQLREIAAGRREPVIRVGNLDSIREFTDVRDVARAYQLLIEKGVGGSAYNIGCGRFVKIRWILDKLCEIAGVEPEVVVDPALYRPADALPGLDITRIREDIGWAPEIPLEQSLADIHAAALPATAS